jgi:hypothetical protein
MIYMTRIQNMSFFLLKVNIPSVRHPFWPRLAPVWPLSGPCLAPVWPLSGTLSGPHLAPVGHPRLAPVSPPSGTPVWPSVWPRLAPSSPLFGRSQGYKFAQICITLCPSCIASLKTLASLLWIHCVRPIVQGGFNFSILDYHDLHDQFNASTFFSSFI